MYSFRDRTARIMSFFLLNEIGDFALLRFSFGIVTVLNIKDIWIAPAPQPAFQVMRMSPFFRFPIACERAFISALCWRRWCIRIFQHSARQNKVRFLRSNSIWLKYGTDDRLEEHIKAPFTKSKSRWRGAAGVTFSPMISPSTGMRKPGVPIRASVPALRRRQNCLRQDCAREAQIDRKRTVRRSFGVMATASSTT